MDTLGQNLLSLEPQYRERVWGGSRLHPSSRPIGEAWVAYGPSRVVGGELVGKTLDELAGAYGPSLLGTDVADRYGARFPLLVKIIDCADWLSIQVHPNDEQAAAMVGQGEFGKTEGWYFVEAEAGARILVGVKPGVDRDALAAAIRERQILQVVDSVEVRRGEALLVPAGTVHALGPGLLLYEIQQASDTTYRVYDWDRPESAGRPLHIEESVKVAEAVGSTGLLHPRVAAEAGTARAIESPYFRLDLVKVTPDGMGLTADTAGRACHVLTAVDGTAEIIRGREQLVLSPFDTALVAGSAGGYEVHAVGGEATLLRAVVPPDEPGTTRR